MNATNVAFSAFFLFFKAQINNWVLRYFLPKNYIQGTKWDGTFKHFPNRDTTAARYMRFATQIDKPKSIYQDYLTNHNCIQLNN